MFKRLIVKIGVGFKVLFVIGVVVLIVVGVYSAKSFTRAAEMSRGDEVDDFGNSQYEGLLNFKGNGGPMLPVLPKKLGVSWIEKEIAKIVEDSLVRLRLDGALQVGKIQKVIESEETKEKKKKEKGKKGENKETTGEKDQGGGALSILSGQKDEDEEGGDTDEGTEEGGQKLSAAQLLGLPSFLRIYSFECKVAVPLSSSYRSLSKLMEGLDNWPVYIRKMRIMGEKKNSDTNSSSGAGKDGRQIIIEFDFFYLREVAGESRKGSEG